MERHLILVLALGALLFGTAAAITRPTLYRLGQEGQPSTSAGVTIRSGSWPGRGRPTPGRRDWEDFQGRGPSGVK